MTTSTSRAYDRQYFDKWYRNPRFRVKTARELARQVAFVVGTAEYILGRPLRTVLDVGCGEGNWRAPLLRMRPRLRYTGVDSSSYVVERYGARRNILLGTIDELDRLPLRKEYDLILCVGMLNYLEPAQLRAGLAHVYELANGPVYLEIFTSADRGVFGDTKGARLRQPSWYRARVREAGFVACGLHWYLPDWFREHTSALERCGR